MKQVTVSIKLNYTSSKNNADAEIETNNVPLTLVLESLNNIVKGLARQIVEEAAEVIPGPDQEKYFDSRLELDRKLLADMIEKAPEQYHKISENDFVDMIIRSQEIAITTQLRHLVGGSKEFTYDEQSRAAIRKVAKQIYQNLRL